MVPSLPYTSRRISRTCGTGRSRITRSRRYLRWPAKQNLDFEDVLTITHMEQSEINRVLSYNRHFDGAEGIERCRP
jgi:hypothetical protein